MQAVVNVCIVWVRCYNLPAPCIVQQEVRTIYSILSTMYSIDLTSHCTIQYIVCTIVMYCGSGFMYWLRGVGVLQNR